ncbi:lipoprotein, partial [Pseudomonas putida]
MRAFFLIPMLLASTLAHAELPETDWLELMPKSDQKALEQMPEIDHNSPEAMGTFTDKGGLKQSKGLPAVMYSTKTVAAMNGKEIRLGGYPVPLESDAKGNSTLFFLVP